MCKFHIFSYIPLLPNTHYSSTYSTCPPPTGLHLDLSGGPRFIDTVGHEVIGEIWQKKGGGARFKGFKSESRGNWGWGTSARPSLAWKTRKWWPKQAQNNKNRQNYNVGKNFYPANRPENLGPRPLSTFFWPFQTRFWTEMGVPDKFEQCKVGLKLVGESWDSVKLSRFRTNSINSGVAKVNFGRLSTKTGVTNKNYTHHDTPHRELP